MLSLRLPAPAILHLCVTFELTLLKDRDTTAVRVPSDSVRAFSISDVLLKDRP